VESDKVVEGKEKRKGDTEKCKEEVIKEEVGRR
jgi:hypothetical protein